MMDGKKSNLRVKRDQKESKIVAFVKEMPAREQNYFEFVEKQLKDKQDISEEAFNVMIESLKGDLKKENSQ